MNAQRLKERKFEKGIVEKSEKEPKILFAHINNKMKVKNKLQRLRVDGEIHESYKAICEVLEKSFYSMFTKEEAWEKENTGDVYKHIQNRVYEEI